MDKKKILIVDDEPEFVAMVKIRLEANGYETLTAFNGDEGLKVAEEKAPDIILLDIMMPEKDGYTTLRELKKNARLKDIPVIVLTAKPGMKALFEVEGVSDYMVKPFESSELMFKIRKILGGEDV